ncbi:MAG: FAD-binding oxidoreductase [Chloroflexi bacterium]|nr:FAD-binding oxidoreductase [Chloroflexota bacterium]
MPTDLLDIFTGLADTSDILTGDLSQYSVDGVAPRIAIAPRDVVGVSGVLRAASASGLAVAPVGGGTKLFLGNRPKRLDVVLGLRRLDCLLEHAPGDLTVTAQAGVTIEKLQSEVARHGQLLPLDVPLPSHTTLGGALAVNLTGPRRLAYGTARDVVIGIRVVDAKGEATKAGGRVVKNVTGYDLCKLYVGSLGTLAVIVEASLRLAPMPLEERTAVGIFPSIQDACDAALDVMRLGPRAMTMVDARAGSKLAGLASPPVGQQAALMVELTGRPAAVTRRQSDIQATFLGRNAVSVQVLEKQESRRLWPAVTDLGWDSQRSPQQLTVRFGVLPSRVAELCRAVQEASPQPGVSLGLVAHVGHGVVRATWWPANGGPALDTKAMALLVAELRRRATPLGSYAIVERCPAAAKEGLDVWGEGVEGLDLMRRIKEQYDPQGTLNPGRFVGGI